MKGADATNAEGEKPKLAVVSPFLNKSNGTERTVIEWLAHLPHVFEIHIYSQQIEDIETLDFKWHRVPKLPGPHLFNFLWWFAANHLWRAWDRRFRDLNFDVVYSPGANCLNADVVSVHIVFAEYARAVRSQMKLTNNPVKLWPKVLHRRLYYKVALSLERQVYTNADTALVVYAQKTSESLERLYERRERLPVLYLGINHDTFNPTRQAALREIARQTTGIQNGRFALIIVGNDWRNKGVLVLLEALARLPDLPLDLLIVTREDVAEVRAMARSRHIEHQVHFLPSRKDVELYYAAADAYVGPSLEDTFALPPAEAMACGLPVIVSLANGTSEIITSGVNGLILNDPADATSLAAMIRRLCEDRTFREQLGQNAAAKAREFTWERNGQQLAAIFEESMRQKKGRTSSS